MRTFFHRPERRPPAPPLPASQGGEPSVDAARLEEDLRANLEGEVRFDAGSRALYATDAGNYRHVPIGVVVPRTLDDVVRAVDVCRAHAAPVLSRGGGTSLAGQCCNVAVVLDWTRHLNRLLSLDPARRLAVVQPGIVLDSVRKVAQESHGLTVGPDPATHAWCTIGGMLGNNSCGAHAQMNGPMSNNVVELEVLTYEGDRLRVGKTSEEQLQAIVRAGGRRGLLYRRLRDLRDRYADLVRARYPKIPRRISGYNLDALLPENGFDVARALVGTEGTCVTLLEATLQLIHSPPVRVLLLAGFPSIEEAGDAITGLDRFGPLALEGIDDVLIDNIRAKRLHEQYLGLFPPGRGFLMLEFGGETLAEAVDRARAAEAALQAQPHPPSTALITDREAFRHVWEVRESGLGATARVPGERDTWEGWEDSAVPPEKVGLYLRKLKALYAAYGYRGALYGHFGQGCIHTRITFDLVTAKGIQTFRRFLDEAADLVVSLGGSLSGEHGDGQARAELLPKMFGEELIQAFREFKGIWDPRGKMNPGRIVDPRPIDADLRLGQDFHPWEPNAWFKYPDDDGRFARATLRCVGVGKCRRHGEGVMCPSYRVTREEEHSTRGRAHLLFEMLEGNVVRGGWRDEHVKESLDLCLACKGCKGECPVNVDMATYKAEFYAHYYKGRLRPRAGYAMGLIMFWARLAALAPELANLFTQRSPFKQLAKAAVGVARERQIPAFAPETFQHWFARRPPRTSAGAPVILWPDTFNNHFFPETARAAAEVLEDAGFRVIVPSQFLCCGRPLYDFGMLATARWLLRRTMRELKDEIEAGVPIVGLEPSCASVFRDELRSLFPDDPLALRLRRQVFLFSEFLERHAPDLPLPRLGVKALVQGHCHQQAILGMADEARVLARLGIDYAIPETGCCGMAGAFGYEKGAKYEVAVACGERVLLPKVREAARDTLIVADGFSCREQIAQATDRRALHLAQVVRMAQTQGARIGPDGPPERGWVTGGMGSAAGRRRGRAALAVVGALAAATWLARKAPRHASRRGRRPR